MSSLLPRSRTSFPVLTDWLENAWPFAEHNLMRIEETAEEGKYTVRAELPGVDPAKDVHVTAEGGLLTITAEREARTEEKGHSEFRYGSFRRTITLPTGADPSKITAKYTDGILEVVVPFETDGAGKHVEIEVTQKK
ncbi:Hsp20/alpha crystallin family protein [Amycolatopsis sp. K13G38]|uniref:Hsp20/alpha crystallin family protein n=1 Tax=Amycolatopsis acididurans TaxID=2724524 RepID=A0ABX1IWD5_9PSEU|nr:Hsp20/alpha crystallin family protein [Amycolatopsis acididurans]NKQ51801.1 Hsp20/alpha crystallin family protein [Amycolatopsis acididurans]